MKIAVLLNSPPEISGGAKSILQLIDYGFKGIENSEKHEFLFIHEISSPNHPQFEHALLPRGLKRRLHQLKVIAKFFLASLTSRSISWDKSAVKQAHLNYLIEKHHCDFLWSCEPLGEPVSRPYATTVWDLEFLVAPWFPEFKENGEWLRREKANQRVLRQASIIVVGTKVGKGQITDYYGVAEDRVLVNPFPLLMHASRNSSPQRQSNIILYPAQFWQHKNHANLLKGFHLARMANLDQNFMLYLTGSDKGTRNKIEKLAHELDIWEQVHFLGFVSQSELSELYSRATSLIFPSFLGPDNLPPLEALSYGCPALVADTLGAREQFGNLVTYFDPNSPSDIASAINGIGSHSIDFTLVEELSRERSPSVYVRKVLKRIEFLYNQYA